MTLRNAENPDGDIAIEFVGLKQGEKLFEELNIGRDISKTAHPRIMRSNEIYLTWDELGYELGILERELKRTANSQGAIKKLMEIAMRDAVFAREPASLEAADM